MVVVDERTDLLHMDVFVCDHVYEPVFEIGVEILYAAECLETDHDSEDWTSDTHRFSAAHRDGYRRKFCVGIECVQPPQRDQFAVPRARQDRCAASRFCVDRRILG